jgi:hypothetical protein
MVSSRYEVTPEVIKSRLSLIFQTHPKIPQNQYLVLQGFQFSQEKPAFACSSSISSHQIFSVLMLRRPHTGIKGDRRFGNRENANAKLLGDARSFESSGEKHPNDAIGDGRERALEEIDFPSKVS